MFSQILKFGGFAKRAQELWGFTSDAFPQIFSAFYGGLTVRRIRNNLEAKDWKPKNSTDRYGP